MATCTWTGQSGQQYVYKISELPCSFTPGKGNYIYAKSTRPGWWTPIYIGEGELNERSDPNSHHKGECIKSQGATHFHWHSQHGTSQLKRRAEEQDLVAKWNPPCNG